MSTTNAGFLIVTEECRASSTSDSSYLEGPAEMVPATVYPVRPSARGSCTLPPVHGLHAEDSDIDLIPHLCIKKGSHMDVVLPGEESISKFSITWIACSTE